MIVDKLYVQPDKVQLDVQCSGQRFTCTHAFSLLCRMLRQTLAPDALVPPADHVAQESGLRTFSQYQGPENDDDVLSQARTPAAATRHSTIEVGSSLNEQLMAAGLLAEATCSVVPNSQQDSLVGCACTAASSSCERQRQQASSACAMAKRGRSSSPSFFAPTPTATAPPLQQDSACSLHPDDSSGLQRLEMTQRVPLWHMPSQGSGSADARPRVIKETQSSQSSPLCNRAPAGLTQCSQARKVARHVVAADATYALSPHTLRKVPTHHWTVPRRAPSLTRAVQQQPASTIVAVTSLHGQAGPHASTATCLGPECAESTPPLPQADMAASGRTPSKCSGVLPLQRQRNLSKGACVEALPQRQQVQDPRQTEGPSTSTHTPPLIAVRTDLQQSNTAQRSEFDRSRAAKRYRAVFCPPVQVGPAPRCIQQSNGRKPRRLMPTPTAGPAFEAAQRRRHTLHMSLTCAEPLRPMVRTREVASPGALQRLHADVDVDCMHIGCAMCIESCLRSAEFVCDIAGKHVAMAHRHVLSASADTSALRRANVRCRRLLRHRKTDRSR